MTTPQTRRSERHPKAPRIDGALSAAKLAASMAFQAPPAQAAALTYAAAGVPVFPCGPDKAPLTPNGFHAATTDTQTIIAWWTKHPKALIGRPTGAVSGVVVIDVDNDPDHGKDGETSWTALLSDHPRVPDTWEALTPRGGRHLYFRAPGEPVPCSVSKLGPGVDVRGDGGYVIAPPSTLPDGRAYNWEGSSDPDEGAVLAVMPDWLLAKIHSLNGSRIEHDTERPIISVDPKTITELRYALGAIPPDDYDIWVAMGHALSELGDAGRSLWVEWSQGSDKWRPDHARKWGSFTGERSGYQAVFAEAQRRGWVNPLSSAAHGDGSAQVAMDEWPDPEPLPTGLPPVQPFNLRLLPAALRPWIADIADRMQCPPDYPAVGAMVALATVVGRQVAIRPKRKDDWTVVPNLWGAVIGRPSLLKTPALQEPLKMVEALEAQARKEFEQAEKDHEADKLVGKARAKESDKAIAAAVKKGDATLAHACALEALGESDPPVRRRYLTHDATIEKLGELLKDNPRGILVFRDELIGFLRSLDQEGREGSRAFYLEAWNGTGSFRFDRIGRGTIDVPAACVSILGGIQPGPMSDYLIAAVKEARGDDGLMQRFQLAVWPDASDNWRNVDRWPDREAREDARAMFERLNQIDPQTIGASQEEGDRLPWLRFDATAQAVFDDWRADLEARVRADDIHPALESHLAKYRSLMPSLALLCHLADTPEGGPVSETAILRAAAWCEYLETHARRIYSPALDRGMAAAVELDKRLASLPDPFTAKDVYRNHWRLLDLDGATNALAVLSDFGRVRGEETQGPGRRTVYYRVHPSLRGVSK